MEVTHDRARPPYNPAKMGMIIGMVAYDSPAAAARRRYVLARLVEHLIGWGCPLDYAEQRAATLLDTVTAAGWTLPTPILEAPARRGPGSTPEGRAAALAAIRSTLGAQRGHKPPSQAPGAPNAPSRVSAHALSVDPITSERNEATG